MGNPTVSPRIRLRVTAPSLPPPFAAPAWVTALPTNRWSLINTVNQLIDLAPDPDGSEGYSGVNGQRSVITGYSGGALAHDIGARGTLLFYGGGHHDYHGTEVYGLDLNTLTYTRYNDPYTGIPAGAQFAPGGWYPTHTDQPNGAPGTPHTYQQVEYYPGRKCLVSLRCQENENSGPVVRMKAAFFPLAGSSFPEYEWQRGSAYGGSGNPIVSDGWSAYDTTRDLIYTNGGQSGAAFAVFDPSTGNAQDAYGTWTGYADKAAGSGQSAAYDPVNDIVVVYRGTTGVIRGFSAATPSAALTVLTASQNVSLGAQCGFKYSPALGGFVAWDNGANVWLLKKNAGPWQTTGWVWTLLTAAVSGDPAPASSTYGPFGRFRVMTYSNAEVALCVNAHNQPLYAFRLA